MSEHLIPKDYHTKSERWKDASCGRHANRYCEADDVWDSTCEFCMNNYMILKERDERIAKAEAEVKALREKVARLEAPVSAAEMPNHIDLQGIKVANLQEVNDIIRKWRAATHTAAPPEGGSDV
jgi:hypothetical protein